MGALTHLEQRPSVMRGRGLDLSPLLRALSLDPRNCLWLYLVSLFFPGPSHPHQFINHRAEEDLAAELVIWFQSLSSACPTSILKMEILLQLTTLENAVVLNVGCDSASLGVGPGHQCASLAPAGLLERAPSNTVFKRQCGLVSLILSSCDG